LRRGGWLGIPASGLLLLAALAGCVPAVAPTPTPVLPSATPTVVTPISVATPPPTAGVTRPPILTPMTPPTRRPTRTPLPTDAPTPTPRPAPLDQTVNILLLGEDLRVGSDDPSWRTDTIMIAALDYPGNQVAVISVPRDLYVEIPDLGQTRINVVDYYGLVTGYPGGGPALVRRVLTETLGIPTQHYVRVQMNGLVRLIDMLGGVTVTLDCPLYERTPDESSPNGLVDWELPAGQVWLNGEQAKKFATYRYVTSDFGRAHRQQQLLWAVRDRALQLDILPKMPELWRILADTFTTDLGLLDVIRLATFGMHLRPAQVHGLVFSEEALEHFITEEGAWVLVIRDREALEEEKAAIFQAAPLSQLGKNTAGGECPPPPTPAPTFTPTPAEGAPPGAAPTATPGG
jgi:LCP family protein required for cell wall assembly